MRFPLALLFTVLLANNALAEAPLSVRTGDHDKYSRIVFEWKSLGGYNVERPDSKTIVVKFTEKASIPKETIEAFNIVGFEVSGENPFTAKLTIPEKSEYRHFAAGERLIVDVYDAPGRSRPKMEEPPPSEHDKPKEEEKKKPSDEPEMGKIIKPDTVPVEPKPKPAETKEAEKKPEVKEAPKQEAKVEPKAEPAAEKKFIPKPNLISISSTTRYGLAAFESGGAVLMVASMAAFAFEDMFLKRAASTLPPGQVIALLG
ncbi:MAG TPA: hypothetical protein PLO23_08520, partial [Alphaproteobacteria bacterium]|nr:hypothetical protein [Alphaproteobacteria bacterium]